MAPKGGSAKKSGSVDYAYPSGRGLAAVDTSINKSNKASLDDEVGR